MHDGSGSADVRHMEVAFHSPGRCTRTKQQHARASGVHPAAFGFRLAVLSLSTTDFYIRLDPLSQVMTDRQEQLSTHAPSHPDSLTALESLLASTCKCRLQPFRFFVSWQGVVTLAYT